jgi:gamma-glutamylaminecyclotransferase
MLPHSMMSLVTGSALTGRRTSSNRRCIMRRDHRLFVYGTLKRGFHNNGFLAEAAFVREARTVDAAYHMVSLRSATRRGEYCPAVRADGSSHIDGELFGGISDALLADLDDLESVASGRYTRVRLQFHHCEQAWMYLHTDAAEPLVDDCDQVAFDRATNTFAWRYRAAAPRADNLVG